MSPVREDVVLKEALGGTGATCSSAELAGAGSPVLTRRYTYEEKTGCAAARGSEVSAR